MKSTCSRSFMAVLIAAGALVSLASPERAAGLADETAGVALITVNGAAITTDDIDAMIMDRHQSMDMSGTDEQLLLRLMEKAINDELILQDAVGMGLDAEAQVLAPVQQKRIERAIALWVGESLEEPSPPTSAQIDAYFREQYRRVEVRQFSVRTLDEAEQVRATLAAGGDWDAMARVMSLDTRGIKGGLHPDKFWIDLEPVLQEAARELPVGAISPPFPYRESWSMIRLESAKPADPADLASREELIRSVLLDAARQATWEAFVAHRRQFTPVRTVEAVLDAIEGDAAIVYTGEFFNESSRVALQLDEDSLVTESELRRAISKLAMEMGTSPFAEILERAVDAETRRLVLEEGAVRGGFLDRPAVVAAYEKDLREALIQAYLNETVVQRIRFDRDEYQRYYDEHKADYRGEDAVQLSFLFLETQAQAEDTAARLAKGADFDFVRKEIMGPGESAAAEKWATLDMFSADINDAVNAMEVGATSPALQFNDRWMIFRLDGRREGPLPTIEELDTQIRNVLFQRAFKEILDEHLELLRANSEIVRHEEQIRQYFRAES